MVRVGDRLFVSAFEAVPGAAPLNNARWALYERGPDGWKFRQRDEKDRTREPCSLRPAMTPTSHVGQPDTGAARARAGQGCGRSGSTRVSGVRPQAPRAETKAPGSPVERETPIHRTHVPRLQCRGKNGEFVLFNKVGTLETAWAFLDREGAWKTGMLAWAEGRGPEVFGLARGSHTGELCQRGSQRSPGSLYRAITDQHLEPD